MIRYVPVLLSVIGAVAVADDVPARRLLMIGIDGCRPDALQQAETPNLDSLIADGAFSSQTKILGERYRKNNTISGPGWSSYLTGVWADKHGVHDNSFEGKNYGQYPHLFRRIKQQYPKARTGSFVNWGPIDEHVVEHADVRVVYPAEGAEDYVAKDLVIAREASQFLSAGEPHVAMVYLGAVDETGHKYGFSPEVPEYIHAIETVDAHVGELLQAVRDRANYRSEDWLVVVSTDHGGKGTGHGDGHDVPEILTTFIIVSGQNAARGPITEPTFVVDVPVTGLVHLEVDIDEAWQLDGRPVGLKNAKAAAR
jgi:predicted AlkP superfamily pyrophosphatase or phosphodiesterase